MNLFRLQIYQLDGDILDLGSDCSVACLTIAMESIQLIYDVTQEKNRPTNIALFQSLQEKKKRFTI